VWVWIFVGLDFPSIVDRVLGLLVSRALLTLVDGATVESVSDEVVAALASNQGPAQFGSFVARVLCSSELVDELYADDATIARMLSEPED